MSDGRGFVTGAAAAQEAAARQGSSFAKHDFFSIEDGDTEVVRFLTEGDFVPSLVPLMGEQHAWIVVDMHQSVPTKGAPKDFTGNWPKNMPAVCRYSLAGDGQPWFSDCYVCDHLTKMDRGTEKPFPKSSRPWALACLRDELRAPTMVQVKEPVMEPVLDPETQQPKLDENNQPVMAQVMKPKFDAEGQPVMEQLVIDGQPVTHRTGFRDRKKEITITQDGKEVKKTVRDVRIVNMGYKNFFSKLKGFYRAYDTLLDRDYMITRSGAELDTDYEIAPMDPIEYASKEVPGEVRKYDVREPEVYALYKPDMPNLAELVQERMSDQFFARFFDPRVTAESAEGGEVEAASTKPETDAPPGALSSLRERLLTPNPAGNGASEEAVASAPAPAAAAPAVAPAPAAPAEPEPVPVPAAPTTSAVMSLDD